MQFNHNMIYTNFFCIRYGSTQYEQKQVNLVNLQYAKLTTLLDTKNMRYFEDKSMTDVVCTSATL